METKLHQSGEITIVEIFGKLSLETSQNFHEACLRGFSNKKVVFALEGLQFVGSSGIQTFFRSLVDLNKKNRFGIQVTGLKGDFQRLFNHTVMPDITLCESLDTAISRLRNPPPTSSTP